MLLLHLASYLMDRISVEDLQQSRKRDSGFLLYEDKPRGWLAVRSRESGQIIDTATAVLKKSFYFVNNNNNNKYISCKEWNQATWNSSFWVLRTVFSFFLLFLRLELLGNTFAAVWDVACLNAVSSGSECCMFHIYFKYFISKLNLKVLHSAKFSVAMFSKKMFFLARQ